MTAFCKVMSFSDTENSEEKASFHDKEINSVLNILHLGWLVPITRNR